MGDLNSVFESRKHSTARVKLLLSKGTLDRCQTYTFDKIDLSGILGDLNSVFESRKHSTARVKLLLSKV